MKKSMLTTFHKTVLLFVSFFVSNSFFAQNVTVTGAGTANGSYATLGAAFTAINGVVQTGNTINVDIVGNTTETSSAILNAGGWTKMTISPSGGAARTISGALAAPLIDLNGTANVIFNGLNTGGNALTISNTDVGNAATSTIRLVNGAVTNTISNCTILGSSTSATLGTIYCYTSSVAGGNSNNLISSCTISAAGANNPANGILSAGTSTALNSGNRILNCDINDFFRPDIATNGIFVSSSNTSWTITGNKIYQTALRTYTVANTHAGIKIATGDNNLVSNNTIGYATTAGTGIYSMTSTIATRFICIDLALGTATVSSVQGNTMSAISLTTSSGAATTNGVLCGVNITSGSSNITNNLVGGTSGVDLMFASIGTAGGLIVGINSSSTGTIVISANRTGGLTSTGTTAALSGAVAGINISGLATGLSITSNTIGNTTANNMRGGTSGVTTGNSVGYGILMISSVSATNVAITNNLIQNISSWGTGTGGILRGIVTASATNVAGIYSILNNTVTNLTTDNANTAVTTGQVSGVGILLAAGTTCSVSGNYVSNIANVGAATTHITVAGISIANGTNTEISFNRISNIINTNPGTTITGPPVAAGINIRSGNSDLLIYNNMISLGNGQSSNTAFVGIYGNHGSSPNPNVKAYFNTINIEGTVTTGALPSFGIGRTDFSTNARTAPYDVRNNIITNTRSGGTGSHYAIANNFGAAASSATGWAANASNYNVLNANPATIGWWTSTQTFAGWKTASAGDGNSYSGITVNYVNSANDLHLNNGHFSNSY